MAAITFTATHGDETFSRTSRTVTYTHVTVARDPKDGHLFAYRWSKSEKGALAKLPYGWEAHRVAVVPVQVQEKKAKKTAPKAESKGEVVVKELAEAPVVRISDRVRRFMITFVGDSKLIEDLKGAELTRTGRGYTAHITTTTKRAESLLDSLEDLLHVLNSGERAKGAKGGMSFQPEAVAKGIEHVKASLGR